MSGDQERDLKARMAELEATVRGLTQELVSTEERIRELEAKHEDAEVETDERATKASEEAAESNGSAPPEEADGDGTDLDDIIVA